MTNALYTPKTTTNQALTARPWGNRITLPILLPVLLVTLLVLSACGGGGAAATINITQNPPPPTVTCETNPFLDSCTLVEHVAERDRIIRMCIIGNAANTTPCANAVAKNPCITNPYAANCAIDFATYVEIAQMQRQTFCRTGDNAGDAFCRPAVTFICDGNIFDGICNSNTTSQESFCRRGTNADDNRNCDLIVRNICDKKPLFDALCTPDVTAQREYCRMGNNIADDPTNCGPVVVGICADDPFDGLCAVDNVARADFCRKGNNLTDRPGDCAPVAIRVCASNVFDGICRNHTTQRLNLCVGNLAGITAAGGVPADCTPFSAIICGRNGAAGTNPFAPICGLSGVNSEFTTITLSRDAFCRADLFNPLCDNGYADAQVSVCHVNGVPTDVNPRCAIIIANACPFTTGARNSACYTLPTALAAAGSTDPEVNYVTGTATELNLVFSQSAVPANISSFVSDELRLSDLDNVTTDEGHGVAWATFTNSQSKYVAGKQSKQRFYAGLLSATISETTGLATPAISRNVKRAEWDGKIALYARNTNRTTPFDFTLLVDFDGNGGRLRANIDIPIPGNNNINDLFIIDGAFNNAGVVYGNTSLNGLNERQESRSSTGSLMGRIGENGVVAAFISDGKGLDGRGLGNYVGGFVASNPYIGDTTVVACGSASTDTPFDPRCVDNDALRIMLCSTRNALATADLTTNCANDRDVIFAICTSSGQYANPFDSVICTDNDLNVQNAFLDNCRSTDTSLRDGADCATVTACAADAFATTCDADTYANSRSSLLDVCNTQALRGIHDLPGCENALLNCATATPDANCGALATTYCAGAAGRTITGDSTTCPVRVTAYCVDYPLNPICEDITENTVFDAAVLKLSRETFCRADIRMGFTNGIRTSQPDPNCIPTIATYCDGATGDEIYDNLCDIGLFTQDFIGETCDSETRDSSLNTLCDSTSTYSVARLKQCSTTNFAHDKCRAGHDPRHFGGATGLCGADVPSTASSDLICKIDPQILRTVGALCGTDDSIAIDPFDAICNDDDLYRPDAESSARTAALLKSQQIFCRQDIEQMACAQTIMDFCPDMPHDDLFDDLCDGGDYLADRITHCNGSFTHAKCETNQMNRTEAAAICGTESNPGTNPFNDVCKSSTLSPNITAMSLLATQRAFCRATPNSDCENTIKGFCDGNTDITILDDLCDGTDYTDARLAYCIHPNADHMECGTVADNKAKITALCTGSTDGLTPATNPFSVACREAFSLRIQIDALCGEGRNPQFPLCMDENAIPDIDRESITASQENFCRGNIALPSCEETIASVCDFATGTDILDTLCSGETYQDLRLITCLNGDTNHENCRGTAGIVATLCPTDGMPRDKLCPLIVDHASYRTSVDDLDANDDSRSGFIDALSAAGVKNKNNPNLNNDVTRAIGFVTDAPATLIRGTSTGLNFGTLPTDNTVIRNGGDPIRVSVRITPQNANTDAYKIGSTNYGYALARATITTLDNSGTFIGIEQKLYAGLLTYSGFGAPNFDNPTVGIWNATMNLRTPGGYATSSATFDLSVDFNAQTIKTLATRPAQFDIVDARFNEPQFTAINSHVFELKNPYTLKTFYQRNSRGEDIVVTSRDTYTDCNGNVLLQGSKVPLCKGGGSPDYLTSSYGILRLDPNGNPMIRTERKTTTGRLTIDASFTRLGLIHGGINIQTGLLNDDGDFIGRNRGDLTSNPGTLVGRISTNQLFAAFASNAGSAVAYAGGFIATPSATPSPTRFTSGGTDKLTLAGKTTAEAVTDRLPHPLGITSNTKFTIGSTTNGFALASENIADGEVRLYAGILSGTDLGNPLFDNSATGTWNAKLNLLMFGNTASADFDLNVDFNTRTIETLADNPAQFTFADVEYEVIQRSAGDSAVTALTLNSVQLYLKDIGSSIDIRVQAGETVGDCTTITSSNPTGTPLAVGAQIPLCEGGGRPIYARNNGNVITKNGIPLIATTTATASTTGRLTVKGRFSSTGKISGTTNIQIGEAGSPTELTGGAGTLTGLIGEAGLVAAFISDPDGRNPYAGGFTATPWICTAGGTPFSKTNCPDANIDAKALRLQLCLDRDPAAKPFATNCAGDATITAVVCTGTGTYANPFDADICPTADDTVKTTFVNSCFADAGHANACATGQVARCLHDPYAFVCKSSMYEQARTAHLDTCGVATAPPNPRCVNLRLQLNSCSVAQPDPSCGTLVNDYCLGGAGRAIAGKTTCVEDIRVACVANALHPRCRDLGVFPTVIAHVAHINKQRDFCAGDLSNLPTGATVSDCNTLGITVQICGSPTAVGTNPFATICSNAMGNPYSEARELKIIQAFFCQESGRVANDDCDTLQQQLDTEFEQIGGRTPYWADNAIREVATPVLNDDGSFKIKGNSLHRGDDPVTKLVQFPINITPAGKVRRDNADVNYIVGGTTQLDLTGLIELDENDQPKVDSTGVVINHEPESTPAAHRGGFSLNTTFADSTGFKTSTDAGSGFAFASATFAIRSYKVAFGDNPNPEAEEFTIRTFGGTKLYTGLLAGTNVGAPLSDFQTEVEWKGKIAGLYGVGDTETAVRNVKVNKYTDKEFTLLVSFYGNFGTIKNKSRIVLDSNAIDIDGRFNDRGLIYGKTRLFRGGNPIATGSLTGLIGANGAVATFISDDENPSNGGSCCTSNFGNYVGGFVALPPASPSTAPRANFETWRDSFQAPNIPLTRAFGTQEFTAANDKQYFIQGTVSSLNRANDNFANERGGNNPITLTLDSAFDDDDNDNYDGYDGIAYLRGTGKRAYAGILSGTVLGAPVTGVADTTARWAGVFQSSSHIQSPTSFTLTVGFEASGGTLDALVTPSFGDRKAGINGTFNADGIISGEVIYGNPVDADSCFTNGLPTVTESCFTDASGSVIKDTATLTGLIGEEGAVAAFIGNISVANNNRGWAGGFVATPDFCGNTPGTTGDPKCNTNPADWVGSFGGTAPPATIAASTAGTGIFGGFLDIAGSAIAAEGLKTMPNGAMVAPSRVIDRTRAGQDGYIFISGYNGNNHQAFVGIRPSTNMGAPLTVKPVFAEWGGRYYNSEIGQTPALTFNIDFDAKSITASHTATTDDSTSITTAFDLGFDPSGVITGMVSRSGIDATARGLIGTEGLVGVFVDTSPAAGPVLFGGFIATNPSP